MYPYTEPFPCPYCSAMVDYNNPLVVHYCTQYGTVAPENLVLRHRIRGQRLDLAALTRFKGEDRLAALMKALA